MIGAVDHVQEALIRREGETRSGTGEQRLRRNETFLDEHPVFPEHLNAIVRAVGNVDEAVS